MYLKQIELENFKSFGNRVTVPLLEGYTAVTGPNGSGKSNISDAILFVLGPKSSKAIRAGKLSDLIFNGGKSKKPASQCKVSLVFDNADRTIPLDYDTVKLTRIVRMSQSSEGYYSYFYVNGRKSTLGEFDSLLAKSRISADGYNLVQQGDVTRIVEMSNLERRRLLDDISGIAVFDEDIERAKRERDEAEDNIERIGIILEELTRQLDQLKEEKEAAIRYLELKTKLDLAKAQEAHKVREVLDNEMSSISQQITEGEAKVQELRGLKAEASARITELTAGIQAVEAEIDERGGEELRELKANMDKAKVDLAMAVDARERAEDQMAEIQEELAERMEQAEALEEEASQRDAALVATATELASTEAELAKVREELGTLRTEMGDCDAEVAEIEATIDSLDEVIREGEEAIRDMTLERDRLADRKERLEATIAQSEESIKSMEFEISDTDWNIRELRGSEKEKESKLTELRDALYKTKREEDKLSKESDELEQAIRSLNREYSHLKAEMEAAESAARGYNRAVTSILEARDRGDIRGIHGTIAELADVDEEYEVALNVSAGGRMQAIVVEDDQVAAEAIGFLKRNKLGRATFLPLNKMVPGRPRGKAIQAEREAVGYAIDLIRFDARYRNVFWYVLGDTVVVDSLDHARRLMGGVRLVTMGGELLEASGAMVGGNLQVNKLRFGSASKGRLEEVSKELRAAMTSAETLGARLKDVRGELRRLEAELREAGSSGGAHAVRVKAMEEQRDRYRNQVAKAKEALATFHNELSEVGAKLSEVAEGLAHEGEEVEGRRRERQEHRERLLLVAPAEMSQRLKALEASVVELSESVSSQRSEKAAAESQLSVIRSRLDDLIGQQVRSENRIERLNRDSARAQEEESRLRVELEGLRRIEDGMDQVLKGLRSRRDELFQERTRAEGEKDGYQTRMETTQDFNVGLQAKLAIAKDRLREADRELESIDIEVQFPLPSMESIRASIRACESSLERMGPVNLKAVDDYDEKLARHDSLRSELERLDLQRAELISLMTELNGKKKVAFMEVFEAVNINFKRVYEELSGGGTAEMALEDPDEPFEAGLIIKAKPRNGKVLRLQALSGGEKSLTALAFIFAIQEYQPSPFYLLDEVDMFLDAVNAEMVARRVEASAGAAQFVQISLRKVTLAKAAHLIGVTRQPNGISKVIMRPDLVEVGRYEEELDKAIAEGTT